MAAAEDASDAALDGAARQFSIALHAEGLMPIRVRKRREPAMPREGSRTLSDLRSPVLRTPATAADGPDATTPLASGASVAT